jgi:hypothetical protein
LQPVPTPEIYLEGIMAGIEQQQALTAKTLIDSGFEPDSVMDALISMDMTKLSHTGMYSVTLGPIGAVQEGKGSLVTGTVGPAGQTGKEVVGPSPAAPQLPPGRSEVLGLLEPWLPNEGDE